MLEPSLFLLFLEARAGTTAMRPPVVVRARGLFFDAVGLAARALRLFTITAEETEEVLAVPSRRTSRWLYYW
jgi:hypothetical protein